MTAGRASRARLGFAPRGHEQEPMMKSFAWCSIALLTAAALASGAGCANKVAGSGGKSTTSSTASGTASGGGGGGPPAGTFNVQIGPITVAPGVENTQCVTVRLHNPNAIHVGAMHNVLTGVSHHMIVYKVDDTVEQTTPVDCKPFANTLNPAAGEPLMITQKHDDELDLPQGVAYSLDANQMIRLELHYINPGQQTATVQGVSTFTPMPDAQFMNEAGFLFAGDIDISLPPMMTSSLSAFIALPSDLYGVNFFAFTGHEHQFGTNVEVSMGTQGSVAPVYNVPGFLWSEPPTVRMTPPAVLPQNGGFQIQCDWNNTKPNTVTFGESANDEMCFFWGYYWPNKGARVCFHSDKFGVNTCCPGGIQQVCQALQGGAAL